MRGADLVENPIGFAEIGFNGNAGKDTTVDAAGDDDVAAGGKAPGRNEIGQQGCEMLEIGEARLPGGGEAVDPLGKQIG